MKNIELDQEFMLAMHTFDISQVRRTAKYKEKEMLAASGAKQEKFDAVLMEMMEWIKAKFAKDPAKAETIMQTMKYFAQEEKRGTPSGEVKFDSGAGKDRLFDFMHSDPRTWGKDASTLTVGQLMDMAKASYAQGMPVVVIAKDGGILHGEETVKEIIESGKGRNCLCLPGVDRKAFEATDAPEFLEACRLVWKQTIN